MPLLTANAILIPEKLPGPELTRIENFCSISTLCSFVKSKITCDKASYLIILVCNFLKKNLLLIFNAIVSSLPVQLITKQSFIIFLLFLVTSSQLLSAPDNIEDKGIIVLMYHRFEENKYPSTNIKIADFIKHLNLIKKAQFKFINPTNFENSLLSKKKERKILITIDDGFQSFYDQAWPILKKEKIPFILFVNTREVGTRGYMSWKQIREVSKEKFAHIGNHSHSHEYLVDMKDEKIIDDINLASSDFKDNLGYNSSFFSYPFGEYSNSFKAIVEDLGFKYAFGQHSGVVDETKDFYELPRFPINEAYGELKRFDTILKTVPFKFKSIEPKEKYIQDSNNPPEVIVEFFKDSKNINLLNCYSNELNSWRKSEIDFFDTNKIKIKLIGKFTTERGRINCSLRENDGSWRWLGMQFVVADIKN
jgi:peptidoglycan/xylan/chitin deacetylase (PgdA/CDA1 family)